jgi:DNA-binding ferritin-like protein
MTVASLLSVLLSSRTQSHIFHLQTSSYSAHVALQEYYEGITTLIDSFAESYQGKYGIIKGYIPSTNIKENQSTVEMVAYFEQLTTIVIDASKEIQQDSYLLNQIDEIVAFIRTTTYKLRHLQ